VRVGDDAPDLRAIPPDVHQRGIQQPAAGDAADDVDLGAVARGELGDVAVEDEDPRIDPV
jgi:hypothetical protein